jgi:hypothetical protein
MKGIWNVLERAGLVRQEGDGVPAESQDTAPAPVAAVAAAAEPITIEFTSPAAPVGAAAMPLEEVYAAAAVARSPYPAERLLRLLDGLKAMDDGTRRQAIQAMDAADDSWTMADPIRDATAKVAALESHASSMRASLAQMERETLDEMARVRQKHDGAVADIKRQIADLEGLMAREIERGAQETAGMETALKAQVDATTRELGLLTRVVAEFRTLIAQFSPTPTN